VIAAERTPEQVLAGIVNRLKCIREDVTKLSESGKAGAVKETLLGNDDFKSLLALVGK